MKSPLCRILCATFILLCFSQNDFLQTHAAVIRVERQVEAPPTGGGEGGGEGGGMPDIMPWVEMGSKYGLIAATTIIIPMGLEILNQTAQG